jgi:CHAD domain-containing protein/adenylate cyclase class IV
MTDTVNHIELELKFRVHDLTAAERYLVATTVGPFVGASQPRATQMEDRYLDTADQALARAGYALRLRATGRGTIVSVKSLVASEGPGGAVGREELEGPADRATPPIDWPPSDARSLVLEHAGDAPLLEVVTIRQLRRKRELRDGSTRVELSLDEVDVVSGKRVVGRFVELEAELTKGDEARLTGLAATFNADPNLRRATGSKLESALAAMRGEPDADDSDDGGLVAVMASPAGEAASEPVADDVTEEPARVVPTAMASLELLAAVEPEEVDDADAEPDDTDHDHGADEAEDQAWARIEAETSGKAAKRAAKEAAKLATVDAAAEAATAEPADQSDEAADADAPPRLAVSKTAGVLADDHIAEAGRKVLRFHLARMLAKEAGTRLGQDPEELHSMRVATRRQRAAWRVFGQAFRPARTKRFRNGLREIAGRLGAVRDLDVLLEAADQYRADLPVTEQRALEPLLADWRVHREDARVLLARELDSEGYTRWVDDYREFVRTEGAAVLPVGPVQPHRVRDTAPSRIWAAYEHVRGYEPVLRWADVETLHDLRIAAKWLRYTLEFVREALGDESAPIIAKVTALQDHLGEMHDADVSASMARAFLVEHAGELSGLEGAAIGRYLVSREREVARLRRTLAIPWRGVAGLPFRRNLGRLVAGL